MIGFRGLTERSSIIFYVRYQINNRSRMLYKFLNLFILLIEVTPNKIQKAIGKIVTACVISFA